MEPAAAGGGLAFVSPVVAGPGLLSAPDRKLHSVAVASLLEQGQIDRDVLQGPSGAIESPIAAVSAAVGAVALTALAASRRQSSLQKRRQLEELPRFVACRSTAAADVEDKVVVDTKGVEDALMPILEEVSKDSPFPKRSKRARIAAFYRRCMGATEECEVPDEDVGAAYSLGEALEKGWEKRGKGPAWRRNLEVWTFGIRSVLRVLKAEKVVKKKGEKEGAEARTASAQFICDGVLKLGPTFVKLAQVASTRTDVLAPEYIEVLKSLQADVPGFSGARAKQIVSKELGRPCDEVFQDFSPEPLAAASLGQVHTAMYNGKKVAIKVQRAGLKELFDVDLKNLQKLAELLDKLDPKTDGADRDWLAIFEQSKLLLYQEIDYRNEASNLERFANDFKNISWVRVPTVELDLTTPRMLTMEFVPSFKLTDDKKIDDLKLDRKVLAGHIADSFLRQVVETGYFHCDPHPGNLCVGEDGKLVFYDFGMMDELKPNVKEGFREGCVALFAGGPMIDDLGLAQNAKKLVSALETMGVVARGADKFSIEKLCRYFLRAFKNVQLGKAAGSVTSVGLDLTTLTDPKAQVFRFPSTFTFVFRAFTSIDGIGKSVDNSFDLGKLAQPFIEKFTEATRYGPNTSDFERFVAKTQSATGLNPKDVNTALTSPRKIAYLEETIRAMEDGSLKIRVRSIENEKQLERVALTQDTMQKLVLASLFLNAGFAVPAQVASGVSFGLAGLFGLKTLSAFAAVKKFDKKLLRFKNKLEFEGQK
eukprot:TRINITY_DN39124_c0_g1_i1.p1 TRINITY_DN39124_c0_g1~~TRINITY_DN39124_c0_g1_i1.p1  ORF type:complete len:763 (-),score=191.49 TRINITY_DN39124_c0_g1_i1:125-2413(-)